MKLKVTCITTNKWTTRIKDSSFLGRPKIPATSRPLNFTAKKTHFIQAKTRAVSVCLCPFLSVRTEGILLQFSRLYRLIHDKNVRELKITVSLKGAKH